MAIKYSEAYRSGWLMAAEDAVKKASQPKPSFGTSRMARPDVLDAQKSMNQLMRETLDRTGKPGRPSSGKTLVTLRLDPDVIAALKAGGKGWQPRANAMLRKALGL
jgi:uncharacterized protein (DUF4415 family)